MKTLVWRRIGSIACILIILILAACEQETGSKKLEENAMIKYYSINDFEHIVEGKSTYKDVYDIAPPESVQVTSYGVMCEYPMEDGGCIRIKFYGEESIVGTIEVDLKKTDK